MTGVQAAQGKVKIVGLVRDKDGHPQFNDYNNVPDIYHQHLTEQDWIYIEGKRRDSDVTDA